jgi:hypothetical protein
VLSPRYYHPWLINLLVADPELLDNNDDGRFHVRYWGEDGRYPLFIHVSGKLAGFALVAYLG